jgi:hypothetical protein
LFNKGVEMAAKKAGYNLDDETANKISGGLQNALGGKFGF